MLIEIPVFISFNAESANQAHVHSRNTVFGRTFTLRFDPEEPLAKAQIATVYPPKADTKFWTDVEGILFGLMPANATDARFLELANQDPESYFADKEAAKRAAGDGE